MSFLITILYLTIFSVTLSSDFKMVDLYSQNQDYDIVQLL